MIFSYLPTDPFNSKQVGSEISSCSHFCEISRSSGEMALRGFPFRRSMYVLRANTANKQQKLIYYFSCFLIIIIIVFLIIIAILFVCYYYYFTSFTSLFMLSNGWQRSGLTLSLTKVPLGFARKSFHASWRMGGARGWLKQTCSLDFISGHFLSRLITCKNISNIYNT